MPVPEEKSLIQMWLVQKLSRILAVNYIENNLSSTKTTPF